MKPISDLLDSFVNQGWVRLEGAFTAKAASARIKRALDRYKALPPRAPQPPEARPLGVTLPGESSFELAELSPAAHELVCAIAGGADKLREPNLTLSDSFVVAPPSGRKWKAPDAYGFGWHVDGTHEERRLLSSPEIGLIIYSLWSDTAPKGGGTFFAPGAMPLLARYINDRPGGVPKDELPYELCLLAAKDPAYFEFFGPAGTVLITHPLLVHAASWNASDTPRLLNVRTVPLAKPLRVSGRRRLLTPLELATDMALDKAAPPDR